MQVSITGVASELNKQEVQARLTETVWQTPILNVYCCQLSGVSTINMTATLFIGREVFGDVVFYSLDSSGNLSTLNERELEAIGKLMVASILSNLDAFP
jgi:hypothetical protein